MVSRKGRSKVTTRCPACGEQNSRRLEVIHVESQHAIYLPQEPNAASQLTNMLAAKSYEMNKCSACALEYAAPMYAPTAVWYSLLYSKLGLFPVQRWEYRVVKNQLGPSDFVIDYGCGSGHFLEFIGGTVGGRRGVDFSMDAITAVKQRGIEGILADEDLDVNMQGSRATHVVSFHVLEHLDDPSSLFRFATTVSSSETLLWVAVPSDKRASRRYEQIDHLDQPPHHLTRWTKAAMEQMGRDTGWRLISFYYEPISIRTKLWELSRRTRTYEHICSGAGRAFERIGRAMLAIPILLLRRQEIRQLSGFSMLACYARVSS